MINLRFHIVSITAVFLALAIGIFMGTSLLQRATVDSLRASQKRLEQRIRDRSKENAAFRDWIQRSDSAADEFATKVQPTMAASSVKDPVLFVGARGIDEGAVSAAQVAASEAGATDLGTIWVEGDAALDDEAVRRAVAEAVGSDPTSDVSATRKSFIDGLARAVESTARRSDASGEPPTGPDPTTTLLALEAAGALTWDSPESGGARQLPASNTRVVLLSGEGAADGTEKIIEPLVRSLGQRKINTAVVAEVMVPRSTALEAERRLGDQKPFRGEFIGPLRKDEAIASALSTIDDLDRPNGRLALVLLLAATPGTATGSYGITDTAVTQYPSASP